MIQYIFKALLYRLDNLYYILRFPRLFLVFWKFRSFTMIPSRTYMNNLVLASAYRDVPGVVVECGTWRGGMIAGVASILDSKREYYLYDSFEGLPDAKPIDGVGAHIWQGNKRSPLYFNNCRADIAEAEKAMKMSGTKNHHITKGWFNETLSTFPSDTPIAILRLDADWYESTMTCLENLYPKVVRGGLIIIDDYYVWDGCSRAVHDYLCRERLNEKVCQWRDDVAYILKRGESYSQNT